MKSLKKKNRSTNSNDTRLYLNAIQMKLESLRHRINADKLVMGQEADTLYLQTETSRWEIKKDLLMKLPGSALENILHFGVKSNVSRS